MLIKVCKTNIGVDLQQCKSEVEENESDRCTALELLLTSNRMHGSGVILPLPCINTDSMHLSD